MKILIMRYNSTDIPGCAATSACNGIGNMYLTSYRGLASLHGRTDLNEDDYDENSDIGAIMAAWVNAHYIGGDDGSWIARGMHDYNQGEDRVILDGEPIYSVVNYGQSQRLLNLLSGPHANEYGIIRSFVAELVRGNGIDYVEKSAHFISFFRIAVDNHTIAQRDENDHNVEWVFIGGERGSIPLRVKHCNLRQLLFTNEGRLLLEGRLSEPYGDDGRVTFVDPDRMANPTTLFGGDAAAAQFDPQGAVLVPDPSFIVLPKVQLKPRDVVPEQETTTTLRNSLPWTVIQNSGSNSRRMHTIEIIDGVTVGEAHPAIRDLDNELPAAH